MAQSTEYYENVFYEYNKIYKKLIPMMTPNEIFCLLKHAAENIHLPNVDVSDYPDGRRLEFIKIKTWYVKGPDIKVIVSKQA